MILPAGGGVLPVDKPAGPTSHDVVASARRELGTRHIGHTGTLDPFASGLLLLCVGAATRLSEYLTGLEKGYQATARLGVRTTTDDPEGEVVRVSQAGRDVNRAAVEVALARLRGPIRHVPPVYSAKKIGGRAAHRRARGGEEVVLEPVEVEITELTLLSLDPPDVRLRVRCSAGTYVRALARDLGEALGTGAHLTALRRTSVGTFGVEAALPAPLLGDPEAVRGAWRTPAQALAHLPRVEVGEDEGRQLGHGRSVPAPDRGLPQGVPVAVVQGAELIAVAEVGGGRVRPRKVFPAAGAGRT